MSHYKSKKLRIKHTELQKCKKHKVQLADGEENDCNRQARKRSNGSFNPIDSSIHLILVFHISGSRQRDIDGMVSTVFDSLIRGGIITDDNLGIIPSCHASFVKTTPGNEGVDIILVEKK